MKRMMVCILIFGIAVSVFAQTSLPEHNFSSGSWSVKGERAFQNDANARLARANVKAPQNGIMVYDFNARYEDGIQDGHGGFGVHIFADSIHNTASWGCGVSYLLWLNYDEKPKNSRIPKGLSAQVYRSYTHSYMELIESVDLNEYLDLLTEEALSYSVPFRIWANADTGEIRVYDPTDPNFSRYYYFFINKKDLPLKGNWVSFRTNGMKMSFGAGL